MQSEQPNLYEQVFEYWLKENHVPFVFIDQAKRIPQEQGDIKNFDFLLWPDSPRPLLTEVKGRTFHGTSLAGLKGLDGWVTFEDVQALSCWLGVFQKEKLDANAVFVFVFRLEQIDVETDGWPVYDCSGQRFLLLAVPLERYRDRMKLRSPRWRTVCLAPGDFRAVAVPVSTMLRCDKVI
ncbi:MAG: HYExAFE family protein [Planctomycetales bacterium]|nr:HYExAFE family protein [Planctomycetales bacterium]